MGSAILHDIRGSVLNDFGNIALNDSGNIILKGTECTVFNDIIGNMALNDIGRHRPKRYIGNVVQTILQLHRSKR